jgi:hypothetical protein
MIANNKFETTWKKDVVVNFRALYHHFPEDTEERENIQDKQVSNPDIYK